MATTTSPQRPTFDVAAHAWKVLLKERGFPTDLVWVFEENLCPEPAPGTPTGFKLGFQTELTPPPPQAEQIAFEHFTEHPVRVVFYRLGSSRGRSICLVLGDLWFETKTEADGYVRRDEWQMAFYPGTAGELEEVTDPQRWRSRVMRERPVPALNFCMTLRSVHEYLAHGHMLSAYERYALRFLHAWRNILPS